jgi:hypothetical protein
VRKQCRFALHAAGHLGSLLAERGSVFPSALSEFTAEVFRTIHSLLTHASNISRLLWPGLPYRMKPERRDRMQSRSARLREALALPEGDHPLRSRELRDHLEHFDERLDEWAATSEHHNLAQDIIGPPEALAGIKPTDRMRWYDPYTATFHFRGEVYSIQQVIDALNELAGTVGRALPGSHEPRAASRPTAPGRRAGR